MTIEIITRCTHPEFLLRIQDSLRYDNIDVLIRWHIIFDTSVIKQIDTELLEKLKATTYFWEGLPGDMGHSLINKVLDKIHNDSWVYILDDDNILHPDLFDVILDKYHQLSGNCKGYIFNQLVDGKDFSKLITRKATSENVKVSQIDMAQFFLLKELIGNKRFIPNQYTADGTFIEELYNDNVDNFYFIDETLCYYNYLQETKQSYTLPRVLMFGSEEPLKSATVFDFESTELNVKYSTNEKAISDIVNFDPDCIITTGTDYKNYPALTTLSADFRVRWIHSDQVDSHLGEVAYGCGMNYIFSNKDDHALISIATPVYNTKERIRRTYESLAKQTHTNWEWVIVNDSTDTITIKIVEELASKDPRIKIYDFKGKSKGIIGEAKYRAFALSSAKYIIELDHDDYLLPHALSKVLEGFDTYPDAGFVYTDCAEINDNYESLMYGSDFAFGYGSYRDETHLGIVFKVADTANINPLTIRHIVGVPNHLRAWSRDVYFEIGGHNRRLSIADDYELLVRTFLHTKFVKIANCCYLQFYHNDNSQNATRADIQRRVRSISLFYTEKIKKRFEELGKEDWAYVEHGISWGITPRKGDEEGHVNYTMK